MKIMPLAEYRFAEILLVDDNEDDVFLTREAFEAAGLKINLHHVDNGEKCLQFLRREGAYANVPAIDLILLDMHMPVMDGYETLGEITKDSALKHLPVVVLSTSQEASDVQKMYNLRCSSYITKPVNFETFIQVISKLAGYWLTVVVTPQPE